MGKHKSQREKLKILRTRLERDEVIANRDIRVAFEENYLVYESMLDEAVRKHKEFKSKSPKRTKFQKEAEKAIKTYFALASRGTNRADRYLERATEAFEQMTHADRAEMNYWAESKTHGYVFDELQHLEGLPIYNGVDRRIGTELPTMAELKATILLEAINEVIGEEDVEVNEAGSGQLKKAMERLNKLNN